MENNKNDLTKYLNDLINPIRINILDKINISYLEITKNKQDINIKNIEKWKNIILTYISTEIDKLIQYVLKNEKNKEIDIINENNNKKEIRIESKSQINFFTSKDIQDKNKDITINFQNEAYKYLDVDEDVENENVALFLKDVAKISRISYNESKKIFKIMKEKYPLFKEKKTLINDENTQKEFSSWIKNLEKENKITEYKNILNKVKLFEKNEKKINQEFLSKLFYDLTIMYFHCNISFPLVEINFKKEDNFNSDKMIDFINRGKNRKVNFVILPSLNANGYFLENGKSWVFTFYKYTFKFEDSINEYLNALLVDNLSLKNIKENLIIKVYCENKNDQLYFTINTNMNIPENMNYEFIFYFLNKKNNNIFIIATKEKSFKIDKSYEIKKYEFKLKNEIIISSTNIIK